MTKKMKDNYVWRTKQKEMKEEEVMKECTFTPEIGGSRSELVGMGHSRSERSLLYNPEKNNDTSRCSRHFTSVNPVEEELDERSSTIRRSRKSKAILKHAKYNSISKTSVEESVKRIRDANQDREIVKVMNENGV
jgi:hypothetical protein